MKQKFVFNLEQNGGPMPVKKKLYLYHWLDYTGRFVSYLAN